MTDIEKEIVAKGLTAPRITPADIEAAVASEHYFTAGQGYKYAQFEDNNVATSSVEVPESLKLLTICVLVTKNGFTVTGESACASPENFNQEIGRKIARANALQKLWPLLGYELKSKLADVRAEDSDPLELN